MVRPTQERATGRWWAKRMMKLVLVVLIVSSVWMIAACALQRSVLFPRHAIPDVPAPVLPGHAERWELETQAGVVEAFYLPPAGASADEPVAAVIHAHGNGELIDFWIDELRFYNDLGVAVLLPEYRGYGRSAGSPSQAAIIDDFERFYDRLAERDEVDGERIFFHGRSLGGAVLATLSESREPAGLVLESTFTSTADMARRFLVPGFLVRDPLPAEQAVAAYRGPVLVLHGEADGVVPIRHGHALHEAAADGRMEVYPTGHNEPMPAERYRADIERFVVEAIRVGERE